MSKVIESLKVKDKRAIFHIMRRAENLTENTFFPTYGFTAGEFAIWQILTDTKKGKKEEKH